VTALTVFARNAPCEKHRPIALSVGAKHDNADSVSRFAAEVSKLQVGTLAPNRFTFPATNKVDFAVAAKMSMRVPWTREAEIRAAAGPSFEPIVPGLPKGILKFQRRTFVLEDWKPERVVALARRTGAGSSGSSSPPLWNGSVRIERRTAHRRPSNLRLARRTKSPNEFRNSSGLERSREGPKGR